MYSSGLADWSAAGLADGSSSWFQTPLEIGPGSIGLQQAWQCVRRDLGCWNSRQHGCNTYGKTAVATNCRLVLISQACYMRALCRRSH
mmetsp:Transcript_118113/g.294504  ORF Transcript_118113/g.294504 Transcript_118113/m.294504 type:complete len:88 (-) Transcript_118113:1419-1682(-)